jgi:hypothetical protein|tara:strand:- start:1628 stop:1885 length:258 start_codon:yes stop_codon:yes gene_type:complete
MGNSPYTDAISLLREVEAHLQQVLTESNLVRVGYNCTTTCVQCNFDRTKFSDYLQAVSARIDLVDNSRPFPTAGNKATTRVQEDI